MIWRWEWWSIFLINNVYRIIVFVGEWEWVEWWMYSYTNDEECVSFLAEDRLVSSNKRFPWIHIGKDFLWGYHAIGIDILTTTVVSLNLFPHLLEVRNALSSDEIFLLLLLSIRPKSSCILTDFLFCFRADGSCNLFVIGRTEVTTALQETIIFLSSPIAISLFQ